MAVYENLNRVREAIVRVGHSRLGSRTSPGKNCRDIKLSNPDFKDGEYWIDPNGDSALDALKVFCRMETLETCIKPEITEYRRDRWTKDSTSGQYFMSDVFGKMKEFKYDIADKQMKVLQFDSQSARQGVTYHCLNSHAYGTRFITDAGDELDSAEGRFKRTTYIDILEGDCETISSKDNQWHRNRYEVRTNKSELLPLVDVLLFDIGGENQQFGIDVGEVCFS